jgi:hypothetical protein
MKHFETKSMPKVCLPSSRISLYSCQPFALMCNRLARFSMENGGKSLRTYYGLRPRDFWRDDYGGVSLGLKPSRQISATKPGSNPAQA